MTKDEIAQRIQEDDLALIFIGSHRSYNHVKALCKVESMYCWDNHKNYNFIPKSALPEALKIRGVRQSRPRENCTMCWGA